MYWIGAKKAALIEAKRPRHLSFDNVVVKIISEVVSGRFYLVPFFSMKELMSQVKESEADCFFTIDEKRKISFSAVLEPKVCKEVNIFLNNRRLERLSTKDIDKSDFIIVDSSSDSIWGFFNG